MVIKSILYKEAESPGLTIGQLVGPMISAQRL